MFVFVLNDAENIPLSENIVVVQFRENFLEIYSKF